MKTSEYNMDQLDDINNNFSECDKEIINTENKNFAEGKANEIMKLLKGKVN